MKKPIVIKSLSTIADKFDTFILDQWGVIHDGRKNYNHALKCIEKLSKLDKQLVIISNSSKRVEHAVTFLNKIGFNENLFVEIITSGQLIWDEIKKPTLTWSKKLGNKCFHLYNNQKKNNTNFTIGLNKTFINQIDKADFILGTVVNPNMTVIDHMPILEKAIKRDLPFICANPDYESVEKINNKKMICMGTIAKLYENIGGKVYLIGKPSSYIFKKDTANIKNLDKSRTLAIGDSIPHDIQGARNFGIKSMLITLGVHKKLFLDNNLSLENNFRDFKDFHFMPDFLSKKLVY